jgi:hypothetical protein
MDAVTVKSIEPTIAFPTVASNSMLFGVLLPVWPTRVTEVVVVMVTVEPVKNVASSEVKCWESNAHYQDMSS